MQIRVCNCAAFRSGIDDPYFIFDGSATVDEIVKALEANRCLVAYIQYKPGVIYILYE